MLLLEALVRQAADNEVAHVLDAWTGYREAARDLQLGMVGVEVKTTTRMTSSHLVQGVHQVEPGHGVDGAPESTLLLVSVGLQWVDPADSVRNTLTLPRLIDTIVDRTLRASGANAERVTSRLLRRISEYGSAMEMGYDHETMATSAAFQRPFRTSFVRCYDMADEAIAVLRSDDVRRAPNVELDSVHYRINLPDKVRGDINPTAGLTNSAHQILGLAL